MLLYKQSGLKRSVATGLDSAPKNWATEGSENRGGKRKVASIWLAGQPPHGFSSSARLTAAAQHQDLPAPRAHVLIRRMAEKTEVEQPHHRLAEEKRDSCRWKQTTSIGELGEKGSLQSVSHLKRNTVGVLNELVWWWKVYSDPTAWLLRLWVKYLCARHRGGHLDRYQSSSCSQG